MDKLNFKFMKKKESLKEKEEGDKEEYVLEKNKSAEQEKGKKKETAKAVRGPAESVVEPVPGPSTDDAGSRKRQHSPSLLGGFGSFGSLWGSETEEEVAPKVSSARRGKSSSKGRGLSGVRTRAQERLLAASASLPVSPTFKTPCASASEKDSGTDQYEEDFQKKLKDRSFRKQATAVLDFEEEDSPVVEMPISRMDAEALRAMAMSQTAAILEVAKKSGNLKGGFIKKLKGAADALLDVVEALASRTESEEARKIWAVNSALRKEVEVLKAENKALRRYDAERAAAAAAAKAATAATARAATAAAAPSPSIGDIVEELKRSVISSVGTMINARFEGIEERLLPSKIVRPPLAVEKRAAIRARDKTPVAPRLSKSQAIPAVEVVSEQAPLPAPKRRKKKKNRGKLGSVPPPPEIAPSAGPGGPVTGPSHKTVSYAMAAKRTPRAAPVSAPKAPAQRQGYGRVTPKLAAPTATAIIISLRAEAAEKGVTYAQVLDQAEGLIDIKELGISSIRFRRTATGARSLEIPSSLGSDKADALAEKFRTAFDGVVDVNRPTKCADIRVTDLDDSITREKLAAALAKAGGCPVEQVKVMNLTTGPGGLGAAIASCPVMAAKAIVKTGKILVGWSSARVHVLEQRPLRCFKCLSVGHTRPTCPSRVDRSKLCYRCGEEGHKSAGCTRKLRCAVCADAGRPSGHLMGGRACCPPPMKGKWNLGVRTAPEPLPTPEVSRREEVLMSD